MARQLWSPYSYIILCMGAHELSHMAAEFLIVACIIIVILIGKVHNCECDSFHARKIICPYKEL